MGHADHGHAFHGQGLHHVEHLADHFRVERRGRLVEQHHLRLHAQRTGDGHALLLAAGQARGVFLGLLTDADLGQQRPRLLLTLGLAALAHDLLRQAEVFQHGHVREQVEVLEDHADFAAIGVDVGLRVGQVDAVDAHRTGVELLQAVQAAQEGRLAGAGRADHHQHLALGHIGGDVVDGTHHLTAGIENLHQVADFNHFARASVPAGPPDATAAG
ncbi:hypothetical protein D9M71_481710 [compost metagenome]